MRVTTLLLTSLCLAAAPVARGGAAYLLQLDGAAILERAVDRREVEARSGDYIDVGDVLRSERDARLELALEDGSQVWVGERSEVEILDLGSDRALMLWAGELAVRSPAPVDDPAVAWGTVRSPAGRMVLEADGLYRMAVTATGYTHLTVERGAAELHGAGAAVVVRAGLSASLFPRDAPESPYRTTRSGFDRFDQFVHDRLARRDSGSDAGRDLPTPVQPYRVELETHGRWQYYEPVATHVWIPRVAHDWRPYSHGYWRDYGGHITWISLDSWGYATHHYGAWDHASHLGWYWTPGYHYAPAWVDWYVFDASVAWCPSPYRAGPRHDRGGASDHHDRNRHARRVDRVERERLRRDYDPDRAVAVRRDRPWSGLVRERMVDPPRVASARPMDAEHAVAALGHDRPDRGELSTSADPARPDRGFAPATAAARRGGHRTRATNNPVTNDRPTPDRAIDERGVRAPALRPRPETVHRANDTDDPDPATESSARRRWREREAAAAGERRRASDREPTAANAPPARSRFGDRTATAPAASVATTTDTADRPQPHAVGGERSRLLDAMRRFSDKEAERAREVEATPERRLLRGEPARPTLPASPSPEPAAAARAAEDQPVAKRSPERARSDKASRSRDSGRSRETEKAKRKLEKRDRDR